MDVLVSPDERDQRGRQSRVVLSPDAGVKFCETGDVGPNGPDTPRRATVANKPGTPGRARDKP
jgi:hypothetical protein